MQYYVQTRYQKSPTTTILIRPCFSVSIINDESDSAILVYPLPLFIIEYRCKFRINDSFGTQAMFNDPEYSRRSEQFRSGYGNLGLQLKQFYTCFREWVKIIWCQISISFLVTSLKMLQSDWLLKCKDIKIMTLRGAKTIFLDT